MPYSHLAIIGAPLDLGAGRRGVDMGPSALRLADLHERLKALHYTVEDLGNIPVEQQESAEPGHGRARYLSQITASCTHLAQRVEQAADEGKLPVVLGGDHSVAVGTVSGLAQSYRKKGEQIGLIWVDAHPDMNTPETSPSGNVHGMPLACILGEGPEELANIYGFSPKVEARNVVLVGLRDVDEIEGERVRMSGVHYFTMRDIDEKGMRYVMKVALDLAGHGMAGIHLSFDMDSVDPNEAPGVGTPVRGGLSYREAHLAMEIACDSRLIRGLEVVEVNPVLDVANRTALLGVELIASALGKRIV
ncbi:MAG: arginase [Bryobacterales bacterium]|nr:arginase [Bryobacterales bacterium]